MSKRIILIFVLQILFFTGCDVCFLKPGRSEYNELTKIPINEKIERIKKLESYSAEKQIDIFLFAADCRRDPSIMGIFVDIGDSKISQIVERIQTSKTEKDKYYLIQVLSDINWKCHCINKTTVEQLSNAISEVTVNDIESEKFFKENYKSYLEDIINQTKQ